MQLPILAPAPLVATRAEAFRDLFENRCQYRHFQNYLTGLMVSGKEAALPPPPPLRTGHESFPSSGSSLSNAPVGTR